MAGADGGHGGGLREHAVHGAPQGGLLRCEPCNQGLEWSSHATLRPCRAADLGHRDEHQHCRPESRQYACPRLTAPCWCREGIYGHNRLPGHMGPSHRAWHSGADWRHQMTRREAAGSGPGIRPDGGHHHGGARDAGAVPAHAERDPDHRHVSRGRHPPEGAMVAVLQWCHLELQDAQYK